MSPQYRRKTTEVISAHQWFGNGDHPDDNSEDGSEGDVVRYYRHPDRKGQDKCRRCGEIWDYHGWIEPRMVKGQKYWQEGATVCPGDYVVTEQVWTNGHPEYTVISQKLFNGPNGYELIPVTAQSIAEQITGEPKILAQSAWDAMDPEKQEALIKAGSGAGVLVIPDDMLYKED